MSTFTFQKVPPPLTQDQFNAERQLIANKVNGITLVGVRAYPYSYLVRQNGAVYEAIDHTANLAYGGSGNAGGVSGTDAAAVANAAAAGGGHIRLGTGVFPLLTRNLRLPSNTWLQGTGVDETVITIPNNWGYADVNDLGEPNIMLRNSIWTTGVLSNYNIFISDLTIDGNGENQTQDYMGAVFANAANCKINNVNVINTRGYCTASYGIGFPAVTTYNLWITNSTFDRAEGLGLPLRDACAHEAENFYFLNNYVHNANGAGVTSAHWVRATIANNVFFTTDFAINVENLVATNTYNNIGPNIIGSPNGIALNYCYGDNVHDNQMILGAGGTGIACYRGVENTMLQKNTIVGGNTGIQFLGGNAELSETYTQITIQGNKILSAAYCGVDANEYNLLSKLVFLSNNIQWCNSEDDVGFGGTRIYAVDGSFIGNVIKDNLRTNLALIGASSGNIAIGNDLRGSTVALASLAMFEEIENNPGFVTKNSGNSTGTGAQQTIAHGCNFTPTYNQVFLSERSTGLAVPYQSAVPNATNIYVLAANGKDYNWKVGFKP